MVVSAILLTALAPITGALFGASYGTSIRIGYEIIFPALFGDMINDQKNKVSVSQEDGAKRTIKALHTMFTATGGASAMEFGIEQGIELAKKKTESQDVQDMIDLNLGLSDRQVKKRGKSQQFQDTIKESEEEAKEISENVKKKHLPAGDFEGMSHAQIIKLFETAPVAELALLKKLFLKAGFDAIITTRVKQIVKKRLQESSKTKDQIEDIIKNTKGGITELNKQIALHYNSVVHWLNIYKSKSVQNNKIKKQSTFKQLLLVIKRFNQFVQKNGKANLSMNSAETIKQKKIIGK